MSQFVQQLQAVHDELTRLMAESRMDVPTRQKIATLANQVADIRQQLAVATAEQARTQDTNAISQPGRRSLVRRAMDLLGQVAVLVITLKKWWKDHGS